MAAARFSFAAWEGRTPVVQALLGDPRVSPGERDEVRGHRGDLASVGGAMAAD